jgi:hypothetical protein
MKYVNKHIIIRPPCMNDPSILYCNDYVDALGQDVENRNNQSHSWHTHGIESKNNIVYVM